MGEKDIRRQAIHQANKLDSLLDQTPTKPRPAGFRDMPFEQALFRARAFENEIRDILRGNPEISTQQIAEELTIRLQESVLPGAVTAVVGRINKERGKNNQKKAA